MSIQYNREGMSKLSSGVGGDHSTYSTWVNSSKFSINIPELTSMWCRYFHILFKTEIIWMIENNLNGRSGEFEREKPWLRGAI